MTIGDGAFKQCGSLEEITLQSSLTTIPKDTFHDCCRLKKMILPNTVKLIIDQAFRNWYSLEPIYLPTSVEEIHAAAFEGCIDLHFKECDDVIRSIVGEGGVDPRQTIQNHPWYPVIYAEKASGIKLKCGPGANNGFGGITQEF